MQLSNMIQFVSTLISGSLFRLAFFVVLGLASVGVLPCVRAVDPPPDGGYPNQNTAEGDSALLSLTTGSGNTAIGFEALFSNTTGIDNTAEGNNALLSNTIGSVNTATGQQALQLNTTGSGNTATGVSALEGNTTGSNNTANGGYALFFNTTGHENTATGLDALTHNTIGFNNTASGFETLAFNTTGSFNTGSGYQALFNNTTGDNNTATGSSALAGSLDDGSTGSNNTADGAGALSSITTGNNNSASGFNALLNNTTGSSNTANGNSALLNNTTGNSNIALGDSAGINLTTGKNNIDIGNKGVAGESNIIRVGKKGTQTATYVAGISGTTVAGGVGVLIDTNGRLGTVTSSARFKEAIESMDKASEAILSLQPVTFRYKHELDPTGIPQFGLVAEQVERVNPDLVARDEEGEPYTVRYEAVNAMLLNEFLKEHRKVKSLEKAMAEQQKENETIRAILKEQAARIQKVNNQLTALHQSK